MRPYYHYQQPRGRLTFGFGWTSTVKALIIINAAVFLLSVIVDRSLGQDRLFNSLFGYTFRVMIQHGFFWQPFTYMFAHDGPGHLFFNMLMLFIFGGAVERRLGRRNFIVFYLACGLGGAVLGSFYPEGVVGASAAVYGVMIAFASFNPDARLLVFFMFPVKARYVALAMVFLSVAGSLSITSDGIAHLGHLGGIVVSLLWLWGRPVWGRLTAGMTQARMARRQRRSAQEQTEMDRLLEKVHREGTHALNAQEKRFMKMMSERYREP